MSQATDLVLSIPLDDGRTITATASADAPADIALVAGGTATIKPTDSDLDTAGHAASTDVAVDVEGHAMTLRLPTVADAVALRRALLVGAVTATIIAAGAVAAMQQVPPPNTTSGGDEPASGPNIPRWGAQPD